MQSLDRLRHAVAAGFDEQTRFLAELLDQLGLENSIATRSTTRMAAWSGAGCSPAPMLPPLTL